MFRCVWSKDDDDDSDDDDDDEDDDGYDESDDRQHWFVFNNFSTWIPCSITALHPLFRAYS